MTEEETAALEAAAQAEAAAAQASTSSTTSRGRTKATATVETDEKPKTAKFTIADRRSLYVGGKHVAAGSEVELEEREGKELMAHGFLVNPDAVPPSIADGPKIIRTQA